MSRELFVDTWFLIALTDAEDSHHPNARRLQERYRRTPLVTHDAVLTEFLAFFADAGVRGRRAAVEKVREVLRRFMVTAADRALFLRALDLYAARPDKEYSLTDCMSMVVMRDRGIEHVLTNDHHFRQEGFTVLFE
jgi:predicted nucleic acid-binding protein